ncbi:STAS/SEC14 domain-containing protein [Microvirga massiliensis]|uniref:STAS/SEC14 domain-containing protein n=1 Tax=Microvirga massiliensis TaxID=1033741 RepID=UPI00062BD294|nr:STAS/SEC14 domain-containing protein [Microvirga massiliensis]
MLELLSAPDQVVAMRVTGRVDEADIERGIGAIEAALAHRETVSLLAEVDMSGMTAGAIAKDLSYSLGRLRDLHRFPRVAIVTSQEWLRTLAEVQNRILPRIEVRAFAPSERDAAMEWASQPEPRGQHEGGEPHAHATPAIRLIETTRPDVIAFEITGKIRSEDMRLLVSTFDDALKAHERLRILVRVIDFDGVSLDALRNEALWSVKMRGLRQVERYALVGGPNWLDKILHSVAPMVRTETRHFGRDEEDKAWEWLEAKPAEA